MMEFDIREAYKRMLTIRLSEDRIAQDFRDNKIFSFYHSSRGQESVAVGVAMALKCGDRVYGNHRSHGHYLACGGDLYRMFCEIYGKADGCCKGYGGSMHMLDRSVGFMGSTPLLGSVAPIAVGSAFEQKVAGSENITVCFIGDGASEEGVVYESINIAALMKLPILFVIEDNLYAVNSPTSARRSRHYDPMKVYNGIGVKYHHIADGRSCGNIASQVTDLMKYGEPSLLHITTYRDMAHSGPIKDESVRTIDTADLRELCDPLNAAAESVKVHSGDCLANGYPVLNGIIADVERTVNDAWQRAKAAEDAK